MASVASVGVILTVATGGMQLVFYGKANRQALTF